MAASVTCPFCGDDDFDLIGLKAHLLRGHCDQFEATIRPEEERFDRPRAKQAAEKQASDAPVWYSAEEAGAWADGYNEANDFCARGIDVPGITR